MMGNIEIDILQGHGQTNDKNRVKLIASTTVGSPNLMLFCSNNLVFFYICDRSQSFPVYNYMYFSIRQQRQKTCIGYETLWQYFISNIHYKIELNG